MRRIIGIAAAFCFLAASASAQTPSPIVAHYRAYQAALERDDLAGAEKAPPKRLPQPRLGMMHALARWHLISARYGSCEATHQAL